MFAGVSSSSRATCPNTGMRRRDRRCDNEVRSVRCSTSSFRARSYHRISSSNNKDLLTYLLTLQLIVGEDNFMVFFRRLRV